MSEAQLRDRIEYLEAENANLRDELGYRQADEQIVAARRAFRIPPQQAKLLLALLDGRQRSYDALRTVLWGDPSDAPDSNVLSAHICGLRAGLRPHGIAVGNIHGMGLQMSAEDCAKARALLGIGAKP